MKWVIPIYLIAMGCGNRTADEKDYTQSIIIHNSMTKKANMIEHRLAELTGDTITVNRDSVAILKELLAEWKNDLVEIPGNEEHDHGDHHHGHSTVEVTPEQMLDIQKELDSTLSLIGKRMNNLKPHENDTRHVH